VGPSPGLDAVEKPLDPAENRTPVIQPEARSYIDRAITACYINRVVHIITTVLERVKNEINRRSVDALKIFVSNACYLHLTFRP
jgi:hypothetical protein